MSFEDYEIPCASHRVPGLRAYFSKVLSFASVMSEVDNMTRWPSLFGLTRTDD